MNRVLDVGLTRDDVVGTYAGLRPLIAPAGDAASTIRASREHRVVGLGHYNSHSIFPEV